MNCLATLSLLISLVGYCASQLPQVQSPVGSGPNVQENTGPNGECLDGFEDYYGNGECVEMCDCSCNAAFMPPPPAPAAGTADDVLASDDGGGGDAMDDEYPPKEDELPDPGEEKAALDAMMAIDLAMGEKELKVPKGNVTAALAKKVSAKDERPSAAAVGYMGVVMMTMAAGIVVAFDLNYVVAIGQKVYHLIKAR